MLESPARKRGRPRKNPASAATPSFPAAEDAAPSAKKSRGRGRPPSSSKLHGGENFKEVSISLSPIVLDIDAGQDVASAINRKAEEFGERLCILSASGAVSDTRLWAPAFNGQKVDFQGHFHIVSMSGILCPNSDEEMFMTVGIASDDGHMFGGALAGPLLASTPCSVVLGRASADTSGNAKTLSTALLGG